MSSGYSQQGFVLSLGLHVSVVAVVAVLAWTKPFERKREAIFELIPLGTPGPASEGQAPEIDFDLPDGPKTPPATKPTPPKPRPAPPGPTPTPPTPRPQATPAPPRNTPPAPTPPPAPPDRVSYEDFVQQHGKPQTRPTTTRTAPPRNRTAPRIDTRFTSTVSGADRASGSVNGSPDAERTEVTLYLANLFDAIERAWEKPSGMELTVAVDIDIAPSGRISNVRIAKSSGDAAYDESALAAVRTVGSGGPTPGGQTLLRTLRFNMKPQ